MKIQLGRCSRERLDEMIIEKENRSILMCLAPGSCILKVVFE